MFFQALHWPCDSRQRDFGESLVADGADELLRLPVRYGRSIDPEATESDAMERRFFGIMPIRSHVEGAGSADHIRRCGLFRRRL
jgi:hypothetical protein